jgi:hypothetical protein
MRQEQQCSRVETCPVFGYQLGSRHRQIDPVVTRLKLGDPSFQRLNGCIVVRINEDDQRIARKFLDSLCHVESLSACIGGGASIAFHSACSLAPSATRPNHVDHKSGISDLSISGASLAQRTGSGCSLKATLRLPGSATVEPEVVQCSEIWLRLRLAIEVISGRDAHRRARGCRH